MSSNDTLICAYIKVFTLRANVVWSVRNNPDFVYYLTSMQAVFTELPKKNEKVRKVKSEVSFFFELVQHLSPFATVALIKVYWISCVWMKLFCVCVCWFGVCVSLVCVWDCVFCTLTGHQRMACVNKSLASCHATLKQFPLWTTLPSLSLWFSLSLSYTQTHSRVCVCVYPPILKNKCDNVTWISFIKPSLCEQVCWCRVLVRPHYY